jgi:hypothetical protein
VFLNDQSLLQVCGSKIVARLDDGVVVVWNEGGTKSFELKRHHNWISSISWNRVEEKSHLFVTGSMDMLNNLQIDEPRLFDTLRNQLTRFDPPTTEVHRLEPGSADCASNFPFSVTFDRYGCDLDLG